MCVECVDLGTRKGGKAGSFLPPPLLGIRLRYFTLEPRPSFFGCPPPKRAPPARPILWRLMPREAPYFLRRGGGRRCLRGFRAGGNGDAEDGEREGKMRGFGRPIRRRLKSEQSPKVQATTAPTKLFLSLAKKFRKFYYIKKSFIFSSSIHRLHHLCHHPSNSRHLFSQAGGRGDFCLHFPAKKKG